MKRQKIFLIDGIGALLTAISLGIILPYFVGLFNMPKSVLIILALIATGFAIYSFLCYFFVLINWKFYLSIIIYANSIYCVATILCMFYFYNQLKQFDIVYFLCEILIILVLVLYELKLIIKNN